MKMGNEGRKSVSRATMPSNNPALTTAMHSSLIKDESMLSSSAINHSSLIVEANSKQPFMQDMSILSQERYVNKKSRANNAMSEIRKSSKLPLNQQQKQKQNQDKIMNSLMRQAQRTKAANNQNAKRIESGRPSGFMRGDGLRQSSQSLVNNNNRLKHQQ